MKNKNVCKECAKDDQNGLEKIMACPFMTPEEKSEVILSRRSNKLIEEFRRKYVRKQEVV